MTAGEPQLYVLLPPSEGKAHGGKGRWRATSGTFGRRLGIARAEVADALGHTTLSSAKLGAEGKLLERARAANTAVANQGARALPAHERYTGVVWEHLDPSTLDDDNQRKRILVPSALLGLVTANDPVPDHRLKFDVSLHGLGRLDRYWRARLTATVKHHVRPNDSVVELLPQEHRAAIDLDDIAKRRHVVRTTFTNTTGHDAKAVKGALSRHLLAHGLDATAGFDWQGWTARYDPEGRRITVSR